MDRYNSLHECEISAGMGHGGHRQSHGHHERHDAVDPFATLLLGGLPVVGRVLLDRDVARHPPQHGMPRVAQLLAEKQLFELLGRRRHAGVALTERDDLEPVAIKLGRQLGGVPAIDGDLTNAITGGGWSLLAWSCDNASLVVATYSPEFACRAKTCALIAGTAPTPGGQ